MNTVIEDLRASLTPDTIEFSETEDFATMLQEMEESFQNLAPETIAVTDDDAFLELLQQLENDNGLASGTAERFQALYNDAASVPESEEEHYASAWDDYHEALDSDDDMSTLARLFGQRVRIPLYDRINATGVFLF